MNLKSYNEYLNENLSGSYNYYGTGSLFPIVAKLKEEGKSVKVVYVYLTSLGIDEDRKQKVISQVFMNESIDFVVLEMDTVNIMEASLFEEDDKPDPDKIEDLLNTDPDELTKSVKPEKEDDDLKNSLDKLKKDDKKSKKEDVKTDTKSNLDALQAVIKDAEKLEKIREILKESNSSNQTIEDNE